VQWSSERIGAIAAALAKAQSELTNPEKSLTATIRAFNPREGDQTFRYAGLSGGLDIVRKTLGTHEIAAVQSTAIDKDAGLIRLTTTLAHSSGEWLSSEWPVCPISETAAPRRMGAALTYARRYALFTLVGIAGEDDLDALDLNGDVRAASNEGAGADASRDPTGASGLPAKGPTATTASRIRKNVRPTRPMLDRDQSATLRDQLVMDINRLGSADDAAEWVQESLPVKNTLVAADASIVEARFRERLEAVERVIGSDAAQPEKEGGKSPATFNEEELLASADALATIQTIPSEKPSPQGRRLSAKTIRLRDKEHCRYVSTQPCVVCGRTPTEAHHIRFAQRRALGRKVSDEYTVPLCRLHHRELHRYTDEASWWAGVSIDPVPIALQLWRHKH
jgi:hypothetical protein